MKDSKVLVYDGSFNGFLTAIYISYEQRLIVEDIRKNSSTQNALFSELHTVFTQMEKAKRVWEAIQHKSSTAIKHIYFAYLSERKGIEMLLYKYVHNLFDSVQETETNAKDQEFYKISQLARQVGKEKHGLETSLNFDLTGDGIYFANIAPDHNILPLLSKYFRSRYKDRPWIIYDEKRRYGIYFNGKGVEMVTLDLSEIYSRNALNDTLFNGEIDYTKLKNAYFKEAGITALINRKLYTPTATKRYSSYPTEKQAV